MNAEQTGAILRIRSTRPNSFLARAGSGVRHDHDLLRGIRCDAALGMAGIRFTSLLLLRVKCPPLAGWKRTFFRARLALFVIDSLLETGYSGEIEPARKFAGEVFENLEMAIAIGFWLLALGSWPWLLAALGFWTKTGVTPG